MSALRRGVQNVDVAVDFDRAAANDNAPHEREVMNVEECALFLGVDRKTVYDYAARGAIPCRRLGKRILFSRRALVLWLGGTCSEGPSNGEVR